MKNIISSPIHGIDLSQIDTLLPFENSSVWLWHITHKKTGYGHWQLILDLDIDDKKIILSYVTTDSHMIDYWDGLDENATSMLPPDYIGRVQAIAAILEHNEETLLDFIAAREVEEEGMFNIE